MHGPTEKEIVGRILPFLGGSAATFNTTGTAAAQIVLAINNPAASGRIVTLQRLTGSYQTAAAFGGPILLVKAPALATVGTVLAKTEDRTSQIATTFVALGATASDGGAATPITPGAGGIGVFRRTTQGPPTGGGFSDFDSGDIDESLEPGESFHVTVFAAATDNVQITAWVVEHLGLG